jgi:hypothetical protein
MANLEFLISITGINMQSLGTTGFDDARVAKVEKL